MRSFILLFLMVYAFIGFAQDVQKPSYVIIANKERIITEEQLMDFGDKGRVKAMKKGVSQELRDSLAQVFGNIIGEKEFVILIELINEQGSKELQEESTTTHDSELKLNVNDRAEDFSVQMTNGSFITLSDFKGKVVLLNFWATWCAPCLMEFYDMQNEILTPLESEDFVFLPISRGEDAEKVKNKVRELNKKGLLFESGIDPGQKIWQLYASQSIPVNFVIDQNGMIRYTSVGNFEGSVTKLKEEIKKLLKY